MRENFWLEFLAAIRCVGAFATVLDQCRRAMSVQSSPIILQFVV